MTELTIFPDRIENWLRAIIPAVKAGIWQPYHAVLMDPPYYLGEIVDRFGSAEAAPAQPGLDGSFARLSRGFMGQTWDGFESIWHYWFWCYSLGLLLRQVCLPGAILMSFGGSRTWDALSMGLRMAGWEIYPQVMVWTYATGSPVQYNIGKGLKKAAKKAKRNQKAEKAGENGAEPREGAARGAMLESLSRLYEGYRSDLKPAFEPILVARNPSGMTYAERAMLGTSAMNIDACRVPGPGWTRSSQSDIRGGRYVGSTERIENPQSSHKQGRYPKNMIFVHHPNCVPERGVCHENCNVRELNRQAPDTPSGGSHGAVDKKSVRVYGDLGTQDWQSYNDSGGASRFYYCPKAAEWEKEAGLDDFPVGDHGKRNPHATVKSIELTTWLARLLLPPQGVVDERRLLVPCAGVGSEMIGAHLAGWDAVDGIEQSRDYARIAQARLDWWSQFASIEQAKSAWDGARKDALREADGQLRMF